MQKLIVSQRPQYRPNNFSEFLKTVLQPYSSLQARIYHQYLFGHGLCEPSEKDSFK